MDQTEHQKQHIHKAIERARDGVGDRIDELDQRLRTQLDVKTYASAHAPQLIAGGAAVGFLVGFGFPKPLRTILKIGLPLAFIAMKVKDKIKDGAGDAGSGTDGGLG